MESKLDIDGYEVKASEVGKMIAERYLESFPIEEALALAFFHGMNWGIARVLKRVEETKKQCDAVPMDLPPQ